MPTGQRKRVREQDLAKMLNITVEEVFEKIPIPVDNPYELAMRINKKKKLGLDASKEESIRKARNLEMDLKRIKEEIKVEPPLLAEQISKLVGLVKGVLDDLQPAA